MTELCKKCGSPIRKVDLGRDLDNSKKAYKQINKVLKEIETYASIVDKIDHNELRDAFKESLDKGGDNFYWALKRSDTMLQNLIREYEHIAQQQYGTT